MRISRKNASADNGTRDDADEYERPTVPRAPIGRDRAESNAKPTVLRPRTAERTTTGYLRPTPTVTANNTGLKFERPCRSRSVVAEPGARRDFARALGIGEGICRRERAPLYATVFASRIKRLLNINLTLTMRVTS